MKTIRIFISSPGDVAEERDKARVVVEQLQRLYGSRVQLQAVLWEDLPLSPKASFQEGIDMVLSKEHSVDIAVFILWSRLGSPVGGAAVKPDGTPFLSGTEREFFLMLEARKQTDGKRPQMLVYRRDDDSSFAARLNPSDNQKLHDAVDQRDLAIKFIREHFQDDAGHNIRAYHSYDKPPTFAGRLRIHLRSLIDEMLGDDAPGGVLWEHDPYRGLEVFDLEHSPIFFGREEEICNLEELLRHRADAGCAFVALVGASGSGKSSLARAGVAASLVRYGPDETVKQWRVAVVQPGAVEGNPFKSLVDALTDKPEAMSELIDGGVSKDAIAAGLAEAVKHTLAQTIKPAIARAEQKAGGPVKLLLIVDQLEELWTDRSVTSEMREGFLGAIEVLAGSGSVWVLATLRTDFYPQAQTSKTFLRLKGGDGQFDLVAPDLDAIQRIIVEPARLAGVHFERNEQTGRSLDQTILSDAVGKDDALPLLEYALGELFKARTDRRELTFDTYEKMGGVEGALGRKAEEEFARLPVHVQDALSAVMHTLVTVNADAEAQALRRTSPLPSVTDTTAKKSLVEALVKQRLLTADKESNVPVVRIAHEALLRRWERLVTWIAANREYLRLRARVEQSQARWQQGEHDKSLLLPLGLPLEEGNKLLRGAPELLTDDTKAYTQQSVQHHDAVARRSRTLRRIVTTALLTMLLLALGGAVFSWTKKREAEQTCLLNQQIAIQNERLVERSLFDRSFAKAYWLEKDGNSEGIIEVLDRPLKNLELQSHEYYPAAKKLYDEAQIRLRKKLIDRERSVGLYVGNSPTLEFSLVPAGRFMMGSPVEERDRLSDEKQHVVTISKAFYMGKYQVTWTQYESIMGYDRSELPKFMDSKQPAEMVSWDNAKLFCDKLNAKFKQFIPEELLIQLPTEAQWEYACRAGTISRFYSGDSDIDLNSVAWYKSNSNSETHPVGQKTPNAFGLYDMHGNLYQWCQDTFRKDYEKLSTIDPCNTVQGAARVLRGGSFDSDVGNCRSAYRLNYAPEYRSHSIGFRVVLAPSLRTP